MQQAWLTCAHKAPELSHGFQKSVYKDQVKEGCPRVCDWLLCIQHKNLHSVTSLVIFLYETLNVMIAFIERNLLKMLMKHMLSLLSFW